MGTLQFNVMVSLEPATLGKDGYREIFQAGETANGLPLIDRQHPHEFLMQAAAVWRRPLAGGFALTFAGAPVGEPALGPVAFMHRASAAPNPTAPLAHHTLDSTHIAMGVLTAALDRGPFQVETSLFNAREPDEQRWDLMDPGALDSWSIRGWYRPGSAVELSDLSRTAARPRSSGARDVRRTTASASWTTETPRGERHLWTQRQGDGQLQRVGCRRHTGVRQRTSLYGRYEAVQVETDLLRFGSHNTGKLKRNAHVLDDINRIDTVQALTLGGLQGYWSMGGLGPGCRRRRDVVRGAGRAPADARPPSGLISPLPASASTRVDGAHGEHDNDQSSLTSDHVRCATC